MKILIKQKSQLNNELITLYGTQLKHENTDITLLGENLEMCNIILEWLHDKEVSAIIAHGKNMITETKMSNVLQIMICMAEDIWNQINLYK